MYCKHCGKEIADDSKFCQYCGGSQTTENASPNDVSEQKNHDIIVETKSNEPSAISSTDDKKNWKVVIRFWSSYFMPF